MFVNADHRATIDRRSHERLTNKPHITFHPPSTLLPYNKSANVGRKKKTKINREGRAPQHIPKMTQIQFAQFLTNLVEYSSELTYFAINAFQTSSLRRVQINTLQRFSDFCVPRACAFYYNLDTEFDNFVQRMRLLCALAKRTFLDMRVARIHFSDGRMMNLPETSRLIDVFKCNISRLRDLKQIHQDIGYDLLLPNDQLYLALDLLITDFEILNCELDAEVKFADAMILQTIIKDIFLQYRIALTWIYPAVKYAAYRPGDPNNHQAVKKCDQPIVIQPIDDYCGKQKKSMKNDSNSIVAQRVTTARRNVNQNYAPETISESSGKHRKKRRKMAVISTATNEFNRYLSEKKLHDVGIINVRKDPSSPKSRQFQQFMKNVRQSVSKKKSSLIGE